MNFSLGEVFMTANAKSKLDMIAVADALLRFKRGDWGEVDPEDAEANDNALKNGGRLLGVYKDGDTKFWIITEADRSYTTVLLPEDY